MTLFIKEDVSMAQHLQYRSLDARKGRFTQSRVHKTMYRYRRNSERAFRNTIYPMYPLLSHFPREKQARSTDFNRVSENVFTTKLIYPYVTVNKFTVHAREFIKIHRPILNEFRFRFPLLFLDLLLNRREI